MTIVNQPGKWNVRIFPGGAVAGPLLCMKACCFPCWGLGSLAAMRKSFFGENLKLTKLQGGESCLKWGCFFMIPPLNCICHYRLRRDIKSDHGIDQGGCIRDALAVTFCFCCALIQVRTLRVVNLQSTWSFLRFTKSIKISGNETTTTQLGRLLTHALNKKNKGSTSNCLI